MDKMKTYEFEWVNIDEKEDSTQFCAMKDIEATFLFVSFCEENNIDILRDENFKIVWNDEDAEYYGEDYITKEEFEELCM